MTMSNRVDSLLVIACTILELTLENNLYLRGLDATYLARSGVVVALNGQFIYEDQDVTHILIFYDGTRYLNFAFSDQQGNIIRIENFGNNGVFRRYVQNPDDVADIVFWMNNFIMHLM